MRSMYWLWYFDVVVILLAAILPTWFVLSGFDLLGATGWQIFSIANSYAFVVIAASAMASLGRRFFMPAQTGEAPYFKGRVAMSFLIVGVMAFFVWDTRAVGELPVDEISSPYISYLISVLFCAGAGYALAYLVLGLCQLFGRKK
ncbi:hypothetical protein ACWKW4_01760 [Hydrogenophaga borbori]